MRLYPELASPRLAAAARDAVAIVALVLLAWLGVAVHDAVDRLAVLGEGVNSAGTSVQGGFESAAEKVEDAPLVGGGVSGALRDAGADTGGNAAELGARGEAAAHRLADLLGLVVFAIPGLLVLALWLPPRIAQIRRLTAASRALAGSGAPERRRLVAMRAAFSLPYGQLLRHTDDPIGDLEAERYEPLVAAALEDAGLRPPR